MTRGTWTASEAGPAALPVDSAALLLPLSGALYFLAASLEIGLRGADAIVVLSPQHGVLLALLMLTRPERWWLIAAAVVPAHLAACWSTGLPLWQLAWQGGFSFILATGITTALRVLLGERSPFDDLRDYSLYVLTAVVAGPALLTMLAPNVLLSLLTGTMDLAVADWQAETLASSLAILTWGSWVYLELLPRPGWLQQRTPAQYVEVLLIAVALYGCFHLTFGRAAEYHTALYLLLIPLLWLSVRFGVAAAAMAVTLVASAATALEHIPQSVRLREAPEAAALDLQIFLIVMALGAMTIAILVDERRRAARAALVDAEQRLIEPQASGPDIGTLRRAELELQRNDERLACIARVACDEIYDWDIARGELWSSCGDASNDRAPSVRQMTMESWGCSIHPSDRERVMHDLRQTLQGTADTWQADYLYIGSGGSPHWVRDRACIVRDANGTPTRIIGAITDRSDHKKLEEANRTLERVGRLAMIGQITASIAHEMNQPLVAIRYNAEAGLLFLGRESCEKAELHDILDDIRRDNRRASELVGRLRELLHDRELRLDPIDINDVITDVVKLLRVESRQRHVQLETECTELPTVLGDYARMQQVLLNLILNGMDAMAGLPETHRRIAIRTARTGATRIQVEVVDRGSGIDPATLPRIFDSFFTSKEHGMGLGLAIARSIVEAHGGRIWAKNNIDGVGATLSFEIDSLDSKVILPADSTDRYGARLN